MQCVDLGALWDPAVAPTLCLRYAAGHGRWDRFMPKILHLMAKPEELATQHAASVNGAWDLENDCRIGSVTRFAASTDPRVVRKRRSRR